ncbi:polyprenyl synthetase family protein [Mycobacterium spongiae]|uniref:Polyprenyl synthetase family protein n=1 Tax=Mycobacterium spongiae TaxID=886343 RepID=A0A975K0R8_9MYCO|nr:polyprenyl synthetase family protein [Mycobacterium spongiae]QUR68569.1 hypothetical protein F6B93_17095 [Mycobacterium spongiae]
MTDTTTNARTTSPGNGDVDARRVTRFATEVAAAMSDELAARWIAIARRYGAAIGCGTEGAFVCDVATLDGGEYVRPLLAAASYAGCGGTDYDDITTLAIALQFLHVGLCAHNDLIDDEDIRHGRPNMLARARQDPLINARPAHTAQRHVTARSVLAGDLAVGAAFTAVTEMTISPRLMAAITKQFALALETSVLGEFADTYAELLDVDTTDTVVRAERKTASSSTVLPLVSGAICAGQTDEASLHQLTGVGLALGLSYQLADDLLSVVGDSALSGKPLFSNIRAGKHTELVRQALRRADRHQRSIIERCLGNDVDGTAGPMLAAIFHDTGAVGAVRSMIDQCTERIAASRLQFAPGLRDHLVHIAHALARRVA